MAGGGTMVRLGPAERAAALDELAATEHEVLLAPSNRSRASIARKKMISTRTHQRAEERHKVWNSVGGSRRA